MNLHRGCVRILPALMLLQLGGPAEVSAQPALEKLEAQVKAPPSASTAPVAAPEPGYLGIMADDVTEPARGVRLVDVLPGGPAQLGGLQGGDFITSIDGRNAASLDEMAAILSGHQAGSKVAFVVRRGQEVRRVDVTLGQRPPPESRRFNSFGRVNESNSPNANPAEVSDLAPPTPPETLPPPGPRAIPHPTPEEASIRLPPQPQPPMLAPAPSGGNSLAPITTPGPLLGVRAVPVTPEMQVSLNLPEPRGALIVEVREGSPAQRIGLPLEAVIVAVDGKPINSPEQLAAAVQARGPGASSKLSYFRYGQLYERTIVLGSNVQPAPVPVPNTLPPPNALPPIALPPAAPTAVSPVAPVPVEAPSVIAPKPSPVALPPIAPTGPSIPTPLAPPASDDETEALRRRVRELEVKLNEMEAKLKEKQK